MFDAITIVAVSGFVAALIFLTNTDLESWERTLLLTAVVIHGFATVVMVQFTAAVGGDADFYLIYGQIVETYMRSDLARGLDVASTLITGGKPDLPEFQRIPTGPVGAMFGFTGIALFLTGGSLYGAASLFGFVSLGSRVLLYRSLRSVTPKQYWPHGIIASLYLPSVIFWSSGLVKEAIASTGTSLLAAGCLNLAKRRYPAALVLLAMGAAATATMKPYLLFPFVIAFSASVYTSKLGASGINATRVVGAGLVALAGVALLSQLFPSYSYDSVIADVIHERYLYRGQNVDDLVATSPAASAGTATAFALLPLALVSCLFRPFFFESYNLQMMVSAVEMSIFVFLVYNSVKTLGWRGSFAFVTQSPLASFCLVFTVVVSAAVGLATPNLGSLARYRMPMMPFYAFLILPFGLSLNRSQSASNARRSPS